MIREMKLAPFVPDRFVGGDDPWTSIKLLRSAIKAQHAAAEALAGQNLTMLRLLAVQVIEQAGVLRVKKKDVDALPQHMGIKVELGEACNFFYVRIIPCGCGANHECADKENQKPGL